MTIAFRKGRYTARFAAGAADLSACQALRHRCFWGDEGRDADRFDVDCQHLMVADQTGALVCTVRILPMASGAAVQSGYAAQFYDLAGLSGFDGPLAEVGRFCIDPAVHDADVLRVAWGALTRLVDDMKLEILFGCSSFAGADPSAYSAAFNALKKRHIGPDHWRPAVKAAEVVRFDDTPIDARQAICQMPPLLRTYLAMGGWVSDHAVIDRRMHTMHVFTCLEVAAIPTARAKALRAVAR